MDTLTYRRDIIAYQVFINDNWCGDYPTERDACNAMHRLALESEVVIPLSRMEIRRLVEERWSPKN
jgi:hypothetical protein